MASRSHAPNRPARLAALAAIAVGAVVLALLLLGGGDQGNRLTATVANATSLTPGQEVHAAGQKVGSIADVEPLDGGRAARITLEFEDVAWPVPEDSQFAVRWGGTVSFQNRHIEVDLGDPAAPPLPEDGEIPGENFEVPVEFDQLLNTLDEPTRADLKTLVDRGGLAFDAAESGLTRSLKWAPPAVAEARGALADLTADQKALETLVVSTDSVVDAVNSAGPGVGELVTGAATTFDAIAAQADSLEQTLARAPQTFAKTRSTLAKADTTLRSAGELTQIIAPGVVELRELAAPLAGVLDTVVDVGPDARVTLAALRRAAPDLNPLLAQARGLAPKIQSIGKQADQELACIRPYTPEIVGIVSTWADWFSYTDGKDKYGHAQAQSLVPAPYNAVARTSGELAANFPGLAYAFPAPPGHFAGQPWFLPQCGAGRDALDPRQDPEARSFDASVDVIPDFEPIEDRPEAPEDSEAGGDGS